jgi:hypothetical protein
MAFNPKMFQQKKKRAVDPNAPPRPNLLSHEKKLKESQQAFDRILRIVERQQDEIETLKAKYTDLQQSVGQVLNYLRKGR